MKILNEKTLLYCSFQYYIIPCLQLGFFYTRNPWIFLWLSNAFLPILDYYLPYDTYNPTKEDQKTLRKMNKFKIPLYINLILDWIMLFWVLNFLTKAITSDQETISPLDLIGMIWLVGQFNLWNFNISHELIHKNSLPEKIIGSLTLTKNLYMHYWLEHLYGHHKRVATKEDPNTARLNENAYAFVFRSAIGGYKSAWNIEKSRLQAKGKSIISWENRMLYYTAADFIIPFIFYKLYGFYGMVIFLVQALISIFFFEIVNYIEHYGLMRKEISPGVYEPVNISHSWNAPHRFTNYLLYKLQRHSDHHENGSKPFQTLCSYEASPMLPHGYIVCTMMALCPPIWFKIMNYLVSIYQKNLAPTKEQRQEVERKIQLMLYVLSIGLTWLVIQRQVLNMIGLEYLVFDGKNIIKYITSNVANVLVDKIDLQGLGYSSNRYNIYTF